LFITSIGGGGSHAVDPTQPEAGGVFAIDVGVKGMPEPAFTASPAVL
jgi:sugar lactone lactonase YvrE